MTNLNLNREVVVIRNDFGSSYASFSADDDAAAAAAS